jgi:hypothetical protein
MKPRAFECKAHTFCFEQKTDWYSEFLLIRTLVPRTVSETVTRRSGCSYNIDTYSQEQLYYVHMI